LHEVEFIRPFTPDGRAVYVVGYIFERTDCDLPWREAITTLQVGGDRGYGRGLIQRFALRQSLSMFELYSTLNLDCRSPRILISRDQPVVAHFQGQGHEGLMEPLVSRYWGERGAGQSITFQGAYYVPGVTIRRDTLLEVQPFGLWKEVAPADAH
jgi:hypothetical protein